MALKGRMMSIGFMCVCVWFVSSRLSRVIVRSLRTRVRCYDVSADVIDVSDIIDDQYLVTFLVPTAIFFAA